MNSTLKYSFFSGKLFRLVFLRESYVDLCLFSDLSADQLLLESRDKRSGTDSKRIVLSLAALESDSVYKALEIKDNLILVLYRAVCDLDRPCIALALSVDLLVNFLLCHSCGNFIHFQAFIFTECDFRLHCDFRCKDKRFALFKLCDRNLRLGHDLKLTLFIGFSICL